MEGLDVRWIARDDTSRDFLDMQELQKALTVPKRISLVGFDACLMSGFEVMYQLKEIADYMVASQEVEPSDGWSYAELLQGAETMADSTEQYTKHIVRSYIKAYSTTDKTVTLSAIDISKVEDVGLKISLLAEVLLNGYSVPEYELGILKAFKDVQRFRDRDYIDLLDFGRLCMKYINRGDVVVAANELINSINSAVIENGFKDINNAHGITMLLPYQRLTESTKAQYSKLDYSCDYPNWLRLIDKLNNP